jgi:hypothetical protein
MPYRRSAASAGSPLATDKRGSPAAVKAPAKSIPAPKVKTSQVLAGKAGNEAASSSYLTVYRADPLERIDMIQ